MRGCFIVSGCRRKLIKAIHRKSENLFGEEGRGKRGKMQPCAPTRVTSGLRVSGGKYMWALGHRCIGVLGRALLDSTMCETTRHRYTPQVHAAYALAGGGRSMKLLLLLLLLLLLHALHRG